MADTEDIHMDSTPIFPAPNPQKRRVPKSNESSKEPHLHHEQSLLSKTLRFLLLLSFIPIMFSVPYVLRVAGQMVKNNYFPLAILWSIYFIILMAIFFYFKKKTITFNSFVTQIMAWMIFTLGIYHLVDLPKMVDITLRKDVLYVWCSFTMVFNLFFFFFDNTDHQEEERKEILKEEKKKKKEEERRKKESEKRKRKLEKMMSPATRKIVNTIIYIAFVGVLGLVANYLYNHYLFLQQELAVEPQPSYYEEL